MKRKMLGKLFFLVYQTVVSAIFAACMNTRQEKKGEEGGKERRERKKENEVCRDPLLFQKHQNLKQTELRTC